MHLRGPRFIACLAITLSSSFFQAQISAWPYVGPSFSVAPAEILLAAQKIPVEPLSDITVLYEESHFVIDAAGRVTNTHRLVYRIETATGVESWSQISANWEPWFQAQPKINARVLQSDGKVTLLDLKTLSDTPASESAGDTFSDDRVYKGPLPALRIGVVVEQETVTVDKEPFFKGGAIYRTYFQRSEPVVRSRLILELPLETPVQYKIEKLPDLVVSKETLPTLQRLTFDQGRLESSTRSDIPLATHYPGYPVVQFSTGKTWQAVAAAYNQLADPQIRTTEVKTILPSQTSVDRPTLIQSIVSRLHKEVRYTGLEFGLAKLQPQTPSEVLKRHYGDCKDKAAVLVAMLRASGIPANLALLNSGSGQDVLPDLPGMNQFDHAIVYIPPPDTASPALWIDATSEYSKVGTLPYEDTGRLALIIAEGTSSLILIPELLPEQNGLSETREFVLPENGPAHVIETSRTTGVIDAEYRSEYGATESKKTKTNLENYARKSYQAKALTSVQHGDGKDFAKPFLLKLDMAESKRATADVDAASVVIFPTGTFNRLPGWFSDDPSENTKPGEKATQGDIERRKAELNRSSEYDVEPFLTEWHYRITIPNGFVMRALPEDKSTAMGPGLFTQHFTAETPSLIVGTISFSSGKPHYTTEEALTLRKAVLDAYKQDGITLAFDQIGAKQLAAGHIREALASDQDLISAHPKEAIHHIQMASALINAGMGEKARSEALAATLLEPKFALAFSTLGLAYQYNAIGIKYGRGVDMTRAIESYRTAKQLDPDDNSIRYNLAVALEFDSSGERYTTNAHLSDAIQEYRELKIRDKVYGERIEDNLLYAMLYAKQYKELLTELATLPSTANRNGLSIAALAASSTVAAGLERANQIAGDTKQRGDALQLAAVELTRLSLYSQASELYSASVQGQDAAGVARQVELYQKLKSYVIAPLNDADPASVIKTMMLIAMSGNFDQATADKLLTRHAYSGSEWETNLKKSSATAGLLHLVAQNAGLTVQILSDLLFQNLRVSATGSDIAGYKAFAQTIGSPAQQFFVVPEAGKYKIVASTNDTTEVGNEALYLLQSGNEPLARALLDWKRDQVQRGGGDDPLEGSIFPRLWTSGENQSAERITVAAASLLTGSRRIQSLLPAILVARDKASADDLRASLNLILTLGYSRINDGPNALLTAQQLLNLYPDSYTAIRLSGDGFNLTRDWKSWTAMLQQRLIKHPSDPVLLRELSRKFEAEGNFFEARAAIQKIIDSGKAVSSDYNRISWSALFDNHVDDTAIRFAQQSNMLSKNGSFSDLHTLACIYAALGKTKEARQILIQAMNAATLSEPNSPTWFALGSIYEQYGVTDAAITAYSKVEKPEGPVSATDTWVLAQTRLAELHATSAPTPR